MNIENTETLKFMITLITIINPIGVIPIFLSLTESFSQNHVKSVAKTCAIAVATTLALSTVFGQNILTFFGISIASFTIGGGVLLFSMAFSMIKAAPSKAKISKSEMENFESRSDLGVVPLAIPILAGPGAISTSIIHAKELSDFSSWVGTVVVILVLSFAIYLILRSSRELGRKLGMVGMSVLTRVFGIILLAISIEMITGGIKDIFPLLQTSGL
ncbi:MarC family protein [Halobacteriovorax sp. GB3]|uniref:MarC family protein n=1 Tax=Halobacteriovorax sp. GB3 TaxID=2719615 RepID=UPI0023600602|nr:MarC family protein [Halobacteriovorax sp. GB3]MDD0853196.1 MarC family protein [Halobacteriovorax sp. GB3]